MADLTLDISEPQVLLNFPGDANGLTEHHRILLSRLGPGRWVAASPDYDLEILDLNNRRHTVLGRRSRFPDHLADVVYAFDPVPRGDLENLKRQAKTMSIVLGDGDLEEVQAMSWVYAHPNSDRLGQVVETALLDDAVILGSKGLIEVDGTTEWIEEISHSEVSTYPEKAKGSLGDVRNIGNHKDHLWKRFISFADAFPLMNQETFADWGFQGPRACAEFLSSVREGGNDLTTYHLQWARNSGVAPKTSIVYEHKNLVEILRLGICRDQLNPVNLMSFELLVRRIVQLEIAVSRSPQSPEFSGLELLMEAPVTESGSASTRVLDGWLTEQLKTKAQIQKQARLYREEMGRGSRDKGSPAGGDGPGGKAKKKGKGSKGAGAATTGAGET